MTKTLERLKARLDAMIEADEDAHPTDSFSRGYRLGLVHAKEMIARQIEDSKALEDKP